MSVRPKLLLIDTCNPSEGVALAHGDEVLAMRDLTHGAASASAVAAVRDLLQQAGWRLSELDALGVVVGPGSFTGVRTGLAIAKGLCEAAALPMVGVSRLAVLLRTAGVAEALAALDAGRGELYLRAEPQGVAREWLVSPEECAAVAAGRTVVIAEPALAARLSGLQTRLCPLHAGDALATVQQRLALGVDDPALVDAAYIRDARTLYAPVAEPPTLEQTAR